MDNPKENKPYFFREEWLEESMEDLYEEAPCGYISTLPDGTIFMVNNTFSEWLGYSKADLLGKKKFQQLLTIGGQIFYETHHSPLISIQGFVKELSYDVINKSGTRLPILVNAVQKKDSQGNPLFNRITVFDYSDRKSYEKELLSQKKKAEAATESKEIFLSTVTHELRTPIHGILGVSDLLQKNSPRQDQKELLDALHYSAENLLHLINDLLDLSKLNSGMDTLDEKPFELYRLVQNITTSLRPIAHAKGLQMQVSLSEGIPSHFIGDSLKIGRVITNLLGNAIKFTEKGQVRLQIENIPGQADKTTLLFSVIDTGIGIPAHRAEAIFQAFTQANNTINTEFGGTGLGLTISQRLLAMYDSQLKVESEPGNGSTFSFTLKLQALNQTQSDQLQTEFEQPLYGIKLLLVEDNASNILIASHYFKFWKLEYDIAHNGHQALQLVEKNDYDIVLMDINMPVMNGYQAAQHIRNLPGGKGRNLPIIALTASPIELIQKKMVEAGIDGMVGKPFLSAELYNAIKDKHGGQLTSLRISEVSPSLDLLNLSKIQGMFEDNDEVLKEFYEALLEDLAVVRQDFVKAANNHDYQCFLDSMHKLNSFIRLFEPKALVAATQKARELYINQDWEKLPTANHEVLEQMGLIISFLKTTIKSISIQFG
jgi:PAS domain S-box-containing protein